MSKAFIGIDVGTGSARAGIFDENGQCLAAHKHDILMFREDGGVVEQSSRDIWNAICKSVKAALSASGVDKNDIGGIGFDATCSLVVVKADGSSLAVGPSHDDDRNVIVWMDHRATEQASRINATEHRVLQYVGGKISPEMETPKLLWLKENKPETFAAADHFFDLADYLTWRASGDLARSVCTVTCKWTYMAHEQKWDESYFSEIGLDELIENDFAKIGSKVVDAGSALGQGLTQEAAQDLGLAQGTPVAAGLIDAHAGGVGTVGAKGEDNAEPSARMAYVFGTSACTMTSSPNQAFVPGVWGPYYSAMVPGLWLNEGGQSAAGAAIAHLLTLHPKYHEAKKLAAEDGLSLPDWLVKKAQSGLDNLSEAFDLVGQTTIVPEFLGNRAPFADPDARAVIAGLGMDDDIESLVRLYIAGICGLGYGLRQILNVQAENGLRPDLVVMSGGAGESELVKQLLADSANINVAAAASNEPVLLGSAMLGSVAAGHYQDLNIAMEKMSALGPICKPAKGRIGKRHDLRFAAFEALQSAAKLIRNEVTS